MLRKVTKYLKTKDKRRYTFLDSLFADYANGQLDELLSNRGFTKIDFFYQIHKKGNYLQIQCWYRNLVVTMEFRDEEFDYGIYASGCSAEEYATCINTYQYSENFTINSFIDELCVAINNM